MQIFVSTLGLGVLYQTCQKARIFKRDSDFVFPVLIQPSYGFSRNLLNGSFTVL
jgi:hypothetical protein